MEFLVALLAVAGLIFGTMISLILFSGVIEGRLPPQKQGRPYPEKKSSDAYH